MKKKSPKTKKKDAPAHAPRTQYAALPWRIGEETGVEICLATSRDTKRWVIPKGWPMKGRKPHIVAAIEAAQEAGLQGKIEKTKLGEFDYEKRLQGGAAVDCRVEVFPMRVARQRKKWPERGQRVTYWFPYAVAAGQVDEPQLRELILAFGHAVTKGERQA
ncbi:NUDIX hydrolase [Methylocystis parvus]|uniref:NUDIX hydrolase n=1 Tax=Methylocystis parvus TaxID=134 RepID=A0A6B8M1P8_9HYPH|nr:NUDIX hydrolase [Methylocystis parvus]QGM98797.1 NUDIX hydrolase [Methylocystis parvus]WBK00853.1 NUDIX hydrolase [Methylocystis parvus OBBP]